MSVNVTGDDGALEFTAGIELSGFVDSQKIIEKGLLDIAKTATDSAKVTNEAYVEVGKAMDSVAKPKTVNVGSVIGSEVLDQLKKTFGDVDAPTQKFIQNLIDLQIKLQNLDVAQRDLTEAYAKGGVTQEEYAKTSAFLVAGIADINKETIELTDKQKEYEESLKNSSGSIDEKKASLTKLKEAYSALSETQRKSPEGENLSKSIASLNAEIKSLNPVKITEAKTSVVSIRTELSKLQELMARNPDSPMFTTWKKQAAELKENLVAVKTGVEQATNSTAGVEAFASGLRGLIGGFEAGTGVVGLFTTNTEQYEEVTKNAASALALVNGIQEISNVLSKTGALNVYLLGLARKQETVSTIAETAATEINTVASGVNTIATEAQAVATVEATVAQRGLAAAMLANPAALVIAGIAALAFAYLSLRDEEKELTGVEKILGEQVKATADIFSKAAESTANAKTQVAELKTEISLAKDGFLDKKKVVDEYNNTIGKTTGFVKDINEAEAALIKNAPAYIEIMSLKAKAAAAGALAEEEIKKQLIEQRFVGVKLDVPDRRTGDGFADRQIAAVEKMVKKNKDDLEKARQNNIDYYEGIQNDATIAAAKLAALNKFNYFGDNEADKKVKGVNALLNEQKTLLQDIANLNRDAKQSGLIREASELDKINEKYDLAIKKVTDYNARVAAFNLKNPNSKIASIATDSINNARAIELQNAVFKRNAEDYRKSLGEQQKAFEDFEKAKVEVGEAKAKELFAAQTKVGNSYLDYLLKQKAEIEKTVSIGPNQPLNLEQQLKIIELDKGIANQREKIAKELVDFELENYKKLLQATVTYNEQKAEINKKYDGIQATLKANDIFDSGLKDQKKQILENEREQELRAVENNAFEHTAIYKQMNEDILNITRQRIKVEIEEGKKILADGGTLDNQGNFINISDEQRAKILEYISKLEEADKKLRTVFGLTADQLKEISSKAAEISNTFNSLADAVKSSNEGLSDTLSTIGAIVGIAGDAAGAIGKFAAGDIVGGIASTVKAITGILSIGAKSRESERKAREEVAKFQQGLLFGELAVNELYRERARQQVLINKLKLQGLADESKLLKEQQAANAKDYERIFNLIQQQNAITSESTKKTGGVLGIGRKTKVVQDYESLNGKTFDELQSLFLSGQLDAKAKDLFQQLEKIKQEGVDIDAAIEQNKLAAQQIFTGTTSDSILDNIVQGFADGKRATADFADNFESLMKQSVLNALKFQALEKPLKKFYEDFAAAAESDGILTAAEIAQLQAAYNTTITAAGKQFDELKKITNLNFSNNASGNGNSLQGAIKGITQQQADLLAGQFGGLRLTAFEQLTVAKSQLNALNQIVNNTSLLVQCEAYLRYFRTTGIKVI
jgi:hypothetical protein